MFAKDEIASLFSLKGRVAVVVIGADINAETSVDFVDGGDRHMIPLDLASDVASDVTGQLLAVDGSFLIS
jgi:hypothetical protein